METELNRVTDVSSKLSSVHYYARERYFRKVSTSVLEVVKECGSDPILVFWKGFSTIMEDRFSEGMRDLEPILEKRDVVLCVPLLLAYAHKKCTPVDREAVQKLETQVRTKRTSCGEKALYNAGMFLWLSGRSDKAREYIDRMLKMSPNSKEGLTLRGWIDLTSGRDALARKSINYFEKALSGVEEPKPIDALFGKAKYLLLRCNFSHSLDTLNQAVASYPGFLPAIIEKMKVLLALQDWEQAIDTAHRCLGQDINCIEANRTLAISLLAREGDFSSAAEKISTIIQLIDRFEPSNHGLYYDSSLALSRLADGKSLVLQQTITLVERAISLAPNNSLYITELAYQCRLNGQLKESLKTYRKAFNQDETSVAALAGIIYCQITDGHLSEAEQQLEFLNEVQSSIGKQAELIFLHALLGQRKQNPASDVIACLDEVIEVHLASIKGVPLSEKYYQLINPYFLHEIATLYMTFAPTEPPLSQSQIPVILRKAQGPVDLVLKCAPGMLSTLFLVAKIKFLSGEVAAAQLTIERCMERDSSPMESHLLMAQIHLQQGNLKQCSSSLEQALSSNFEVQSYAVYHLVKALVEKRTGNLSNALSSLQTALSLTVNPQKASKSLLPPLSPSESVTVYLELANVHTQLGQSHEAAKVMQDAINRFADSPEEVRISIANADLALARGDSDQALSLLKSITDDKPYYTQAVEKMAEIYYKERKDKKMYVQCYKELSEKLPGPPTSILLGDAYMNIQEPELAVGVYESALKSNPRDGVLASKVGQALVKTHHYNKAINYYEAALKTGNQPFLRGDLAELYFKLKQYDRAERTLVVALDHKGQETSDLQGMMEDTKYLLLLAKVQKGANRPDLAQQTLSNARDLQFRVLKRVKLEQPGAVAEQQLCLAKICCKLANLNVAAKNYSEAQQLYREALSHDETFLEARLALADLFLLKGELELCEQECVSLLRIDPDNERATMLRADLLFRVGDYSKAVGHFQDLLRKTPDNFEALVRLIELNRRSGQLMNSVPYLDDASKACARSAYEPGLNYCKGLMKRYQHSMNEALQCFNQARKDSEWGERALFAMIEICLNPENETLGGEVLKSSDGSSAGSKSEDQMAVKTAEKLLKEVRPKSPQSEQKVLVLENFTLLATKNKQNVERALEKFTEMAAAERDSIPVLLGMATAHMLLKQVPRARNQLKRVTKITWTSADAEEFEKCWLLLADIYIQSNKLDVANEMLKKCVTYNQSCSKAWEYLGYVSEKDSIYKDAATYYENAWRFCHFSDPNVGYRLAFNYIKAKRFVEAVDVCHKVLEKHPTYPKIRKEILDKARLSLRP